MRHIRLLKRNTMKIIFRIAPLCKNACALTHDRTGAQCHLASHNLHSPAWHLPPARHLAPTVTSYSIGV